MWGCCSILNYVASMIQLPVVIASIAKTLIAEIDSQHRGASAFAEAHRGPSYEELSALLAESGASIQTPRSGY